MKSAVIIAGEWFLSFVVWVLFTDSLALEECIAGAISAAVATALFEVSKRAEPLCFSPPVKAVLQAWRLPGSIIQGTWILILELGRTLRGRRKRSGFQLAPFSATAPDCRSAGKRALAILYGTLPPNSLIVDIDRKSELLLFHQLRKGPAPVILRRLESA